MLIVYAVIVMVVIAVSRVIVGGHYHLVHQVLDLLDNLGCNSAHVKTTTQHAQIRSRPHARSRGGDPPRLPVKLTRRKAVQHLATHTAQHTKRAVGADPQCLPKSPRTRTRPRRRPRCTWAAHRIARTMREGHHTGWRPQKHPATSASGTGLTPPTSALGLDFAHTSALATASTASIAAYASALTESKRPAPLNASLQRIDTTANACESKRRCTHLMTKTFVPALCVISTTCRISL